MQYAMLEKEEKKEVPQYRRAPELEETRTMIEW